MRSCGFRRGTRKLLAKRFKEHGMPNPSRILTQFKVGDHVDCVIDPSMVKGMPHKYYHGKTGIVFNCNPRSYGVIFHKRVGGKYIERTMHIRVEHLRKSRCSEETRRRTAERTAQLKEAREQGLKTVPSKHMPAGPRAAFTVLRKKNTPVEVKEKVGSSLF